MTNLAAALDALTRIATEAGIDPAQARLEGERFAAAIAEPAPGAFVDWSTETGRDTPDAVAFMEAAGKGRRFRSAPTDILGQLRVAQPARAQEYALALADVSAAACLLGTPTAQVAGAATMAAAAQTAPYGSTPSVPAGSTPAPQDDFQRNAPAILNQVLAQLRSSQEQLAASLPGLTSLNLNGLDAHAPGAFDLTGPAPTTQQCLPPSTPAGTPPAGQQDTGTIAGAPAPVQAQQDPHAAPAEPKKEEPKKSLDELLAELDELIGLDRVKAEIKRQAQILRVEGLRTKEGLSSPTITRHLVFVGNPGTGKTTVARLVGQIYASLGVLSKGQLIETDRSGLVAGYLGQTALKTQEVITSALGGVLFIDEAYSLNGDQYGMESINTLVKAIEDHRDDLVVIVAGYPLPMAEFISNNPGLTSRFRTTIEFEDYSDDEITDILKLQMAKADYDLGPGAEDKFREILSQQVHDMMFGNGRFARNMLEAAIGRHAWRLRDIKEPTIEQLRTLLPEDFVEAPEPAVGWDPTPGADLATEPDDADVARFDEESPAADPDETLDQEEQAEEA